MTPERKELMIESAKLIFKLIQLIILVVGMFILFKR